MLRFSLFGFPVSIHWMFWLTAALISGQLDRLSAPDALHLLGIWMAVVFLSVLWHELGHGLVQRRFGARPEIALVAFGGMAIAHGGRFTRRQAFLVAAAGPAFGLALGALAWSLYLVNPPVTPLQANFYRMILFVNIAWSLINLLPILPLDGGHMLQAALGPKRLKVTAAIGIAISALTAVLAFTLLGSLLMSFFFAFFAYQNVQVYRRQIPHPTL